MKAKVRNAEKVLSLLSDLPGKPVIAKQQLTIQFPVRFTEVGLAKVGSDTFVFGLFVIIDEAGNYAVCNVNSLIELGKSLVEKEIIDGVEYLNFIFQPGDVIIKTKELICRPPLVYKAIDEFVFKGKVPWYVEYDDMGKLFDTAKHYAKTRAEILPSVTEFMAAYIARDSENRINFIRETAKDYKDFKGLNWVPMQSVYWSAPGTVNKLAGAYFQDGIISAIVNPSERVDKIERILRT